MSRILARATQAFVICYRFSEQQTKCVTASIAAEVCALVRLSRATVSLSSLLAFIGKSASTEPCRHCRNSLPLQ